MIEVRQRGVFRGGPAILAGLGALVLAVAIAAGVAPSRASGATGGEIADLLAQPCPDRLIRRRSSYSSAQLAAAANGSFVVLRGLPAKQLVPPVDWNQNPFRDRSWVHYLHTLTWLDPLLHDHFENGNKAALASARDLVLDWIAANPRGVSGTAADAWKDKSAGDRASYLGYVARAAACEGLLTHEQAGTLIDSIRGHLAFLLEPASHPPHNHALFVDIGLAVLGRYASFLPEGPTAFERARQLFSSDLAGRLEESEGVWLEHSSAYQFLIARLVAQFAEIAGPGPYTDALRRIRDAAGWMVTPAHRQVAFGDSNRYANLPAWASAEGESDRGLRLFRRSGLAIVKERDGYLLVTAGFHSNVHKHADDLGFQLYDRDRNIVSDSGVFHYNLDKWRQFSRSTRAHSVLTVDDREFPVDRSENAYGSGIVAGGRGAGWYAIEGRNPLLRKKRVRHRRIFLYRPGRALLVVDVVRSRRRHVYRRHFQIASGLTVRAKGRSLALRGEGFSGSLRNAGTRSRRQRVAGRFTPPAGWEFPGRRQRLARPTVTYRKRARNANFITAFGLSGRLQARIVSVGRRARRVKVSGSGAKRTFLRVRRHGRRLQVARSRRR